MAKSEELKMVMLLAIVVGICLVGIFGLSANKYVQDIALLNDTGVRIFVNILFWSALILCIRAISIFIKLYCAKRLGADMKVLASLGLVVAIAHVGQFAVAGLEFFQHMLLPSNITAIILSVIWWTALGFVLFAFKIYREL